MLLIAAMIFDIVSYKVPNLIILIGLELSFACRFIEMGWKGTIYWLIGILMPVCSLFLLYLFHVIGAGDIKLFSVIGSFLNLDKLVYIMILAFIIGAIISVIQLIRFQNLSSRLHYLASYIQLLKQNKKIVPYYNQTVDGYQAVIPFTIAITISAIGIMVFGKSMIQGGALLRMVF